MINFTNHSMLKTDQKENYFSKNFVQITDQEFELFRSFIYDNFGINLTDAKRALLMNRLQKILKQKRITSFQAYYDTIQKDKTSNEVSTLVDAISTNHTFFFREKAHFDFLIGKALPEITPELKKRSDKDLRIWCAASSTGEEPYVLAMLIKEYLGSEYSQWSAGVLATDISNEALSTATDGVYTLERISQVPPALRDRYFEKLKSGAFRVKEYLRKEVLFRRFNLMNETLPFKKPFHIIFCRNVMIYFDQQTRQSLIKRLYKVTVPGGYLFIGNAETLDRHNCPYEYVAPSIYRKST